MGRADRALGRIASNGPAQACNIRFERGRPLPDRPDRRDRDRMLRSLSPADKLTVFAKALRASGAGPVDVRFHPPPLALSPMR